MALRDQPYFPLYVQDYLTDEKLNECTAATQGVYIKLLCIMHKSEPYGTILLKQKDKQNDKQILNFAIKLGRNLTFSESEIFSALTELINESVLVLDGDKLIQRRMVKDNAISVTRSAAGKKGGFARGFAKDFAKAKTQANTEYEYEYENEYEDKTVLRKESKERKPKKKKPDPVEITYPFTSDQFYQAWKNWKDYKKETFKFIYRPIGEQAALVQLSELADGDEPTAIKLIINAMAKGWQGIYKMTENGKFNTARDLGTDKAAREYDRLFAERYNSGEPGGN